MIRPSLLAAALLPFAALLQPTFTQALQHTPEQIHIAFGKTSDLVAVQWSTRSYHEQQQQQQQQHRQQLEEQPQPRYHEQHQHQHQQHPQQHSQQQQQLLLEEQSQPRSLVRWGKDPAQLDQVAEGLSVMFVDGGEMKRRQQHHIVNMTGLEASTRYHYQVGDETFSNGLSQVYSFKTAPDAVTLAKDMPIRLAVYGDMGVDRNGSTVMRHLIKHLERDADFLDGVVHVGDFAYDMEEREGVQGDLFMRQIEPIAARLPYMTSMGNHEKAYNFLHYSERFRNMPVSDGEVASENGPNAPNNWWYSFNLGPVHLVAVSTEIYDWGPLEYIPRQYQWLEEDLKQANANRTLAPWIIVHGHKPLYCSSPTPRQCDNYYRAQRDGVPPAVAAAIAGDAPSTLRGTGKCGRRKWGLEELFYRYGVDVYICGHEHNSERHFDIAPGGRAGGRTSEMEATTYIVTGAGGDREGNTPFESEQPERVASRAEIWGYSILEVHNSTHLYYEQRACDLEPKEGGRERDEVVDKVWLVQHRHGSFECRPEEEGEEEVAVA